MIIRNICYVVIYHLPVQLDQQEWRAKESTLLSNGLPRFLDGDHLKRRLTMKGEYESEQNVRKLMKMPWNWNHSINFVDYDHFQVFKCCSTGTRIDTQATPFSFFSLFALISHWLEDKFLLCWYPGHLLSDKRTFPSLSAGTDTFEFSSEWRCHIRPARNVTFDSIDAKSDSHCGFY